MKDDDILKEEPILVAIKKNCIDCPEHEEEASTESPDDGSHFIDFGKNIFCTHGGRRTLVAKNVHSCEARGKTTDLPGCPRKGEKESKDDPFV